MMKICFFLNQKNQVITNFQSYANECVEIFTKNYFILSDHCKKMLNGLIFQLVFSKDLEKANFLTFESEGWSSFEGLIIEWSPHIVKNVRKDFYDYSTQQIKFYPLHLFDKCMNTFIHESVHAFDDIFLNISEKIIIHFIIEN